MGARAQAQCKKDTDCKGDRVCEDGRCAAPRPPLATPAAAPVETPATAPAGTLATPPAAPPATPSPVVGPPRVITVETPSEPPKKEEPRHRVRSVPLIVAGGISSGGGFVGLAIGLGSSGATCYHELRDDFREEHCERSPSYLAYGVGAGLLVAGVTMFVIGIRRVPAEPEAQVSSWLVPRGGGLSLRLAL
ncbi:MAG TPA: hypothetical protein VHB79_33300 [Polyangiaceae bacterium]|nr:hypothetical protein [Polyangiaceae bacterium]